MKQKVILDPAFRTLHEIFEPTDLERLHTLAEVIWGRDEPMPPEPFKQAKQDAFAIVTGRWRHGRQRSRGHDQRPATPGNAKRAAGDYLSFGVMIDDRRLTIDD